MRGAILSNIIIGALRSSKRFCDSVESSCLQEIRSSRSNISEVRLEKTFFARRTHGKLLQKKKTAYSEKVT